MVAGCGATCVKYLFFTFNFLIFVCGGAVLGVSLWARFDSKFRDVVNNIADKSGQDQLKVPPVENMYIVLYIMAAIGAFLLLCGFLGCCGACCENTCLLGLFFFIILILLLAEIAGGIYIFVKKGDIQDDMRQAFQKLFDKSASDKALKDALEKMQTDFKCCGASGCIDAISSNAQNAISNLGQGNAPSLGADVSCCTTMPGARGCADIIYDNLKNNFTIVAIVCVALVVIELLAMIFACILCNSIRHSAYSYY